ncbi:MAG TPA: iron-containing redox enzyme family protein [Kofleriaceae bacterium]|nr:iron-containing redox enzyme family protein [Kofleriaceae bacterium]
MARPEVVVTTTTTTTTARAAAVDGQLAALRRLVEDHSLWRGPLLSGFAQGAFSRDELRYIFSQYHCYTTSFTRFIAAVMANCENDLFRAQLSENLWEEGGGCDPARRHAQIFRNFLQRSLDIDNIDTIAYTPYTRQFVRDYLDYPLRSSAMSGAAFLSLGTEGIVARMYQIMRSGLRQAGIAEHELEFFDIHIACDDAHAATLENMMASYAHVPGWFEACTAAANRALELRAEFFDNIFDALQRRRLEPMLQRMQDRASLARGLDDSVLCHRPGSETITMYANEVEKLNIKFTVERLPLAAEVLDPRMVRIPPGKFNEKHKHAHETLIHILEGTGQVLIDDRALPVRPGDTVLVPRWAMHQTQNLGTNEMRFLAVTDFRLSERAYVGNPTDYRMHVDVDGARRGSPHSS